MTQQEFLDKFGEPQGWALAVALEGQIKSYREAVRNLSLPAEKSSPSIFDDLDPATLKAINECIRQSAEDRLRQPVVDLEKAQAEVWGIEDKNLWSDGLSLTGDYVQPVRPRWTPQQASQIESNLSLISSAIEPVIAAQGMTAELDIDYMCVRVIDEAGRVAARVSAGLVQVQRDGKQSLMSTVTRNAILAAIKG